MPANRAIVVLEEGKEAGIRDVPKPRIRDEWMIVKPKAWGLNPTDWKHVDHRYANAGARLGVEFAGVVEEVGSKVTNFKKGDRVAGFCHGG
jgi:NADPH:quinone reductase-like Zn-dependent oxidoreductase